MVSESPFQPHLEYFVADLVEPVVELLGTGLAAEVPSRASKLPGDAFLAELVTVVAADTLQTQPLDKILLKQELTSWEEERRHILKKKRQSATMPPRNHLCGEPSLQNGLLTPENLTVSCSVFSSWQYSQKVTMQWSFL